MQVRKMQATISQSMAVVSDKLDQLQGLHKTVADHDQRIKKL